ncbi:hypothetical protein EDB83DRAFT_1787644 [Lactarius deliciosus]|nr:hypothetical protein EDB83DRAFT_1787644 [Lactarius deliciosus]
MTPTFSPSTNPRTHTHAVRIPRALAPKLSIFGLFSLGPASRGLLPFRSRVSHGIASSLFHHRSTHSLSLGSSSASEREIVRVCLHTQSLSLSLSPSPQPLAVRQRVPAPRVALSQPPVSVAPPTPHIPFKMSRSSSLATRETPSEPALAACHCAAVGFGEKSYCCASSCLVFLCS